MATTVPISGIDTSDANAASTDIVSGKTAYVDGEKVTGSIPLKAAQTYTPTTTDQNIALGQYLSGIQTIKGDSNLASGNIKSGTTIFGVSGSSSVVDTSDADAVAGNILSGKKAYVNGSKVTGNIASKAAATYTPGTTDQTIASGQYLSGVQTIKGDADLVSGNIKSGVDIFGVSGSSSVVDTSDANATASQMLSGKTGYVNGSKVTGNISSKAAATYTPGTTDQTIASGQYLSGVQTIKGDSNLVSGNIKSGATIFGVSGASAVVNTSDANATAGSILSSKTAYVNGSKITGNISSKAAATYNVSSSDQTISSGQYLSGTQTIRGVTTSNISAENIKSGVTVTVGDAGNSSRITSVTGTLEVPSINNNIGIVHSSPTPLSIACSPCGIANSNYALFAIGYSSNGLKNTVNAYSTSLTRSAPAVLSVARAPAASWIGSYALFAGGSSGDYGTDSNNTVDAYDLSLTRSTPTALSVARYSLAGTNNTKYAFFAGGYGTAAVEAYNSSLTRSIPTTLSVARYNLAGASLAGYGFVLFAGGMNSNNAKQNTVDAYNTSLTRSIPTALNVARYNLAGSSNEVHGIFAGGYGSDYENTVDAYNSSLTRSTPTALSVGRAYFNGISLGYYALFAGGTKSGYGRSDTVDTYDSSLIRSTPTVLKKARDSIGAAKIGSYALFAGGRDSNSNKTDFVDIYGIQQILTYNNKIYQEI